MVIIQLAEEKGLSMAEGILGARIAIANQPDISAFEQAPGNISGGDSAQKVTQGNYQPGHICSLYGAGRGTRTHKDYSGGF